MERYLRHILKFHLSNIQRGFSITRHPLQKDILPVHEQNALADSKKLYNNVIRTKFLELVDRYEEITGLKEVKMYQDRVIKVQDELLKIQDKRRLLNEELMQVTIKRNELQTRFHSLSRDDPLWFTTIGEENRLLLEERKIRNQLSNVERDERDFFTHMSNAVRDSHEKQRWQSDRTKYWSLILTIISSFLTYLISNWRHKRIINDLIENNKAHMTSNGVLTDNGELNRMIKNLNESTRKLQMGLINTELTKETVNKLEKSIGTAISNENEIKTDLKRLNSILSSNHMETMNTLANKKEINFLGEGQENLNDIHAVHGPSFGLGILCTFGILALIKMMFSSSH